MIAQLQKAHKSCPLQIFATDVDNEVLRQGLCELLAIYPGIEVCGEAADEAEAVKQFRALKPDVSIVDISLRQRSGIDLIKRLRAADPAARILVLSMHDEMVYAPRVLRAGAMGYVSKQAPTRAIMEALQRILGGKMSFSRKVNEHFMRLFVSGQPQTQPSPVELLSDREIEVLESLGRGLTADQIAANLRLSVKTVHSYRERLKAKLNVNSASELNHLAVRWVIEHE